MDELIRFYNLDECVDKDLVIKRLNLLKKQGKIEYYIDGVIIKIDDLDLEDKDISKLLKLFSDNDIFPEPDYDDDDFVSFDSDEDYDDEY